MRFLTGNEAANYLEDIVYEKKQVHKHCVDLTVGRLYKVTAGGELDFGGGEYSKGEKKPLKPRKKDPQDDYGWWEIEPGSYLVKLNERFTIAPVQKAFIQPHSRLLKAGATHPNLIIEESGEIVIPLNVLTELSIKENSRITEFRIIETTAV
ncbi:MAG: dCTP deaminase [Elusimicrobiota bacterium]